MVYLRKLFTYLIFILILSCLASCSSSKGPLFKRVSNIPAHQSVVYLFRSNDKVNTDFLITLNDKKTCIMENNGYFPVLVNEGKVVIKSFVQFKFFATGLLDMATADSSLLVFKADPGKSYYVECLTKESSPQELNLKLVPENYGGIKIKNCPLLKPGL